MFRSKIVLPFRLMQERHTKLFLAILIDFEMCCLSFFSSKSNRVTCCLKVSRWPLWPLMVEMSYRYSRMYLLMVTLSVSDWWMDRLTDRQIYTHIHRHVDIKTVNTDRNTDKLIDKYITRGNTDMLKCHGCPMKVWRSMNWDYVHTGSYNVLMIQMFQIGFHIC